MAGSSRATGSSAFSEEVKLSSTGPASAPTSARCAVVRRTCWSAGASSRRPARSAASSPATVAAACRAAVTSRWIIARRSPTAVNTVPRSATRRRTDWRSAYIGSTNRLAPLSSSAAPPTAAATALGSPRPVPEAREQALQARAALDADGGQDVVELRGCPRPGDRQLAAVGHGRARLRARVEIDVVLADAASWPAPARARRGAPGPRRRRSRCAAPRSHRGWRSPRHGRSARRNARRRRWTRGRPRSGRPP